MLKPEPRFSRPHSVWLMLLIPYNFVEDFFIIFNVSRSIRNESIINNKLGTLKGYGFISGFGWCFAQIISIVQNDLGMIGGIVAIPFWGGHWILFRSIISMLKSES